jgi:KUP system potassium uptake protein
MEQPNVPKALGLCRKQGLKFDIMSTSFFLGGRSVVASATSGMPLWQDKLFIFLLKNAANPTDFYHIPPGPGGRDGRSGDRLREPAEPGRLLPA